jgi:hypothetical protein
MRKNPYRRGLDQVKAAYSSAFENVRQAAGKTTDRNVMFYESLEPEIFQMMVDDPEIGWENTIEYIREMESRRRKEGKHGK